MVIFILIPVSIVGNADCITAEKLKIFIKNNVDDIVSGDRKS